MTPSNDGIEAAHVREQMGVLTQFLAEPGVFEVVSNEAGSSGSKRRPGGRSAKSRSSPRLAR